MANSDDVLGESCSGRVTCLALVSSCTVMMPMLQVSGCRHRRTVSPTGICLQGQTIKAGITSAAIVEANTSLGIQSGRSKCACRQISRHIIHFNLREDKLKDFRPVVGGLHCCTTIDVGGWLEVRHRAAPRHLNSSIGQPWVLTDIQC